MLVIASFVFVACVRGEDAKPAVGDASGTSKSAKANDSLGQRREGAVGQNEELSFKQAKVSAEMTELEERMYRLSEAIKRMEPENSSRLMSGVKYAREELILHEMKDLQDLLTKSDYKLAAGQEKEVLVKLDRLEQLLLSTDLDLQLQLQKLRALREILHRLDTAIQEEDREQKLSATSTDRDHQLQTLPALREKLDELIRKQTAHVAAGTQLAAVQPAEMPAEKSTAATKPVGDAQDAKPEADAKDAVAAAPTPETLLAEQKQTRDEAKALEERLAELGAARGQMDEAIGPLEKQAIGEALPHQKEALESLKKLAARLDGRQKEITEALSQEKFNEMKRDQEQNHSATDSINEAVRQLGDSGAARSAN